MSRRRNQVIDEESNQEEQPFRIEKELRDLQSLIDDSLRAVMDTGADLAESGNYDESQKLAGVLKEFLIMEQRIGKEIAKADQFGRSIMTREGNEEASRDLEEFKALKGGLNDSVIKWSDNSIMKEYNEITWECGPGYGNRQGYPLLANDDGREDELMIQVRDSLICPISQGLIKDPVKNPACQHSYSKEMIERLFMGSHYNIACPVSGCREEVHRRRLVRDDNLERKISKIESRIFNK